MNLRALALPLGLELVTPHLMMCAPRSDENLGAELNGVVCASWQELRDWMPWAKTLPSVEDSTMHARHAEWKWESRSELDFSLRLRETRQLVGKCGLHTIDANVGRAEIGYWLDSRVAGHGLMSEAVARLVQWADELGFQRLEIRCDARNFRSSNVAKRAHFQREGTLRRFRFDNADQLCDIEIWSRLTELI